MAQALLRRRHLLLAGSAAALGLPNARAQAAWPAKPVNIVVPFHLAAARTRSPARCSR